ncbi:LOW QUALITY PROTEIN: cyclic AMP-responsive element-binding protein 3-like [Pluvialis apricaria]
MLCPEELAAPADEDLLDFLLKDDAPCPEIPGEENSLLKDWGLPEPEVSSSGRIAAELWGGLAPCLLKAFSLHLLNEEMDDFISSLLSPFEDEPGTLQGYSPVDTDSSISEDWNLSHSPGSDFAGSPWSSDVVQFDHNYSLHRDWSVLESVRSEMAEGDVSIGLKTWTGLEGTSEVLEQSSSFSITVAVDAGPQLVPKATVQSDFPELVLTEEERQLLEKKGVSLPTCLPLTKAEEQLLKKVHWKIRNKQSAQDSGRRKKIYVNSLENRVAARRVQNHELQKKVQLLQKQNMSLLEQAWKLQALVRQSTTKTTTASTYIMVLVLSFCLMVSTSICSFWSRVPQPELRVECPGAEQICEFPNQEAGPDVQEEAALERLSPEPEDPSFEQPVSHGKPNPRSAFNNNLSSDPLAAAGSELNSQPQEQHSQNDPLHMAVPAAWKAKRQEWVECIAGVVIQQHCANEM